MGSTPEQTRLAQGSSSEEVEMERVRLRVAMVSLSLFFIDIYADGPWVDLLHAF
jgi:hypothetical protein